MITLILLLALDTTVNPVIEFRHNAPTITVYRDTVKHLTPKAQQKWDAVYKLMNAVDSTKDKKSIRAARKLRRKETAYERNSESEYFVDCTCGGF